MRVENEESVRVENEMCDKVELSRWVSQGIYPIPHLPY